MSRAKKKYTGADYDSCRSRIETWIKRALRDVQGVLAPFGADDRLAHYVLQEILNNREDVLLMYDILKEHEKGE